MKLTKYEIHHVPTGKTWYGDWDSRLTLVSEHFESVLKGGENNFVRRGQESVSFIPRPILQDCILTVFPYEEQL